MDETIRRRHRYADVVAVVCLVALVPGRPIGYAAADYTTDLYASGLSEGSPCTMEDGSAGVCAELPRCPMRIREVQEGRRLSTSSGRCSFKGFVEIVCCPLEDQAPTTTQRPPDEVTQKIGFRPADVACHEYENEIINEEGEKVNPNIFNGESAQAGEFPYMAALGYRTDRQNPSIIKYVCGGTLISLKHILSAAHCVSNVNNDVPVEARLGSIYLDDQGSNVQRIPIAESIPHPSYRRGANYYDIAIIKLMRKVNTSNNTMPICLQTRPVLNLQQLINNSIVITAGWGATSFQDPSSNSLQKTPSLQIVERDECSGWYQNNRKLQRGLDDSMICVLDRNVTRRSDACQGDSGGPLLLLSRVSSTVLGVTSFGQSCSSPVPAVYTSVYYYLDWIEATVWSEAGSRG